MGNVLFYEWDAQSALSKGVKCHGSCAYNVKTGWRDKRSAADTGALAGTLVHSRYVKGAWPGPYSRYMRKSPNHEDRSMIRPYGLGRS